MTKSARKKLSQTSQTKLPFGDRTHEDGRQTTSRNRCAKDAEVTDKKAKDYEILFGSTNSAIKKVVSESD